MTNQNSPQEEKSLNLTLLFVGAILLGCVSFIAAAIWWLS